MAGERPQQSGESQTCFEQGRILQLCDYLVKQESQASWWSTAEPRWTHSCRPWQLWVEGYLIKWQTQERKFTELTPSEQEIVAKGGMSICCHQDLLLTVNICKSIRKFSYLCKTRLLKDGMAFH